ncbi:hypothetical protein BW43_01879 [Pseudomonas sp. RIT357]|nr:hypothetical protein BW43_01879 [Pseudomonas sp. RIT357]
MAVMVRAVGSGLLKPSVYFRPTAQPTSNNPAKNRMIQDMMTSLLQAGSSPDSTLVGVARSSPRSP